MSLVAWSDKLSVGVSVIDAEHKELINLLKDVHEAIETGQRREVLGAALDVLIAHTVAHFAHEEILFAETGYPDAEAHKNEHKALIEQILDVQRGYRAGELILSPDVLKFLRRWLILHIKTSDMKYGRYQIEKEMANGLQVNTGHCDLQNAASPS